MQISGSKKAELCNNGKGISVLIYRGVQDEEKNVLYAILTRRKRKDMVLVFDVIFATHVAAVSEAIEDR